MAITRRKFIEYSAIAATASPLLGSTARIEQHRKEVSARGLRISCVSSSANMHDTDPEKHEAQLADARKFIDLASALGTAYVRVFGNKVISGRATMFSTC